MKRRRSRVCRPLSVAELSSYKAGPVCRIFFFFCWGDGRDQHFLPRSSSCTTGIPFPHLYNKRLIRWTETTRDGERKATSSQGLRWPSRWCRRVPRWQRKHSFPPTAETIKSCNGAAESTHFFYTKPFRRHHQPRDQQPPNHLRKFVDSKRRE